MCTATAWQEAASLLRNSAELESISSFYLQKRIIADVAAGNPPPTAARYIQKGAEARANIYKQPGFETVLLKQPWAAQPIPTANEIQTYMIESIKNVMQDLMSSFPILAELPISAIRDDLAHWADIKSREYKQILNDGQFDRINDDGQPQVMPHLVSLWLGTWFPNIDIVSPVLPTKTSFWTRRARVQIRQAREAAWTRLAPLGITKGVSLDMAFDGKTQDKNAAKWAKEHVIVLPNGESRELAGPGKQRHQRKAGLLSLCSQIQEICSLETHTPTAVTITLPEQYHPTTTASGKKTVNPDWNGQTAREALGWFGKRWNKMRVYLKRAEIDFEFLKIIEPHKDGTPHWHILFWIPKDDEIASNFAQLLHKVFIFDKKDPPSPARLAHGLKIQPIKNGNAVGYMLKYLTKQTDTPDDEDEDESESEEEANSSKAKAKNKLKKMLDSNPVDWRRAHNVRSFSISQNAMTMRNWLYRKRFHEKNCGDEDILAAADAVQTKDLAAFRVISERLRLHYEEVIDKYGFITKRLDGILNTETGMISFLERCEVMSRDQYNASASAGVVGANCATPAAFGGWAVTVSVRNQAPDADNGPTDADTRQKWTDPPPTAHPNAA